MRTRRTEQMDNTESKNAAPRKSACGNSRCQCARIMANLELSKTPYFYATDLDTRRGPALPLEFMLEHGQEIFLDQVILDSGKAFAVQIVEEGVEETIRIGPGSAWEAFIVAHELQKEDLIFFSLHGQSRFFVTMVRGHSRRNAETPAQVHVEPQIEVPQGSKHKSRKIYSEALLSDDPQEGSSKRKRPKPSNVVVETSEHRNTAHVNITSSEDAFQPSSLLESQSSESDTEASDDCSNFEDESEFRRYRSR